MLGTERTILEMQNELATLREEKVRLENKVRGLQAKYGYDLDLIEELSKKQLGMAEANEKVIIFTPKDLEMIGIVH